MKKAMIVFLLGIGNISLIYAQIPKTSRPDSVMQDHMIYEPNKSHPDSIISSSSKRNPNTDSVYTNPRHGTRKQDSAGYRKQSKKYH